MPQKKNPPPGCDLTLTCKEVAAIYGVAVSTASRWKSEAGVTSPKGSRGVRSVNLGLWGQLAQSDWEKGYSHVGMLMGVSPQAVHQMRDRLLQEGLKLPKLGRGRPRRAA